MNSFDTLLNKFLNYERQLNDLPQNFETQFVNFFKFTKRQNNPQQSFKSIHIVGSKGKGSVAQLLSQLMSSSYKTGLFTSPHLLRTNERIQINNKKTPFSRLYTLLKQNEILFKKAQLSYFEILTFLSFLNFKEESVQWGIFEAGLGGRLDATNVLMPKIIIITTIEREHQNILGNTLTDIAKEKLSVIKHRNLVFSMPQEKTIKTLLEKKIKATQSKLFYGFPEFHIKRKTLHKTEFIYKNKLYKTNLNTNIQIKNLCFVFNILDYLQIPYHPSTLMKLKLPGRFEIRGKNPFFIFDVAHTPVSFQYLLENLSQFFQVKKMQFILSFYKDKKISTLLTLLKKAGIKNIYYAETNNPRNYSFFEFKNKFSPILHIQPFSSLNLDKSSFFVFAGSFSLYSLFYKITRSQLI